MQVLVLAVQNAVDYSDLGVATSGATLFRSIGGSVGTAVFGSIFTNRLATELDVRAAAVGGQRRVGEHRPRQPGVARPAAAGGARGLHRRVHQGAVDGVRRGRRGRGVRVPAQLGAASSARCATRSPPGAAWGRASRCPRRSARWPRRHARSRSRSAARTAGAPSSCSPSAPASTCRRRRAGCWSACTRTRAATSRRCARPSTSRSMSAGTRCRSCAAAGSWSSTRPATASRSPAR